VDTPTRPRSPRAVYSLVPGEQVGKVWSRRGIDDLRPLDAFDERLASMNRRFRTPRILAVDIVDGIFEFPREVIVKKDKVRKTEELLRDVEAGRDIAPKSVGLLATLCAEYEMSVTANEEEANAFHQRVQSALEDMDVNRYLDSKVGYAIRLLESENLYYEEDRKLANLFEQIGSLMFFRLSLMRRDGSNYWMLSESFSRTGAEGASSRGLFWILTKIGCVRLQNYLSSQPRFI
jgi:hypothetical protein